MPQYIQELGATMIPNTITFLAEEQYQNKKKIDPRAKIRISWIGQALGFVRPWIWGWSFKDDEEDIADNLCIAV